MLADKKYYRVDKPKTDVDKQAGFSKQVGSLLRKARKANNYTQADVASFMSTSQKRISEIESGNCRHNAYDLVQFSRIYKKPISYFYMTDY